VNRWDAHFQALSRSKTTADFGTVFGKYTVAELQDLVNAKDDEMANLAKYAASASSGWKSDFQQLQSDYAVARKSAQATLDAAKRSIFADNLNDSGDAPYRALMGAFNPRWQQNDASTNRPLQLLQRLNTEGVQVAPYTVRQPRETSDAYQYMARKPLQYFVADPVRQAAHHVDSGIAAAEEGAKKAFEWSKPVLIAAAVVAGVLGFVLVKPYLPTPPHPQLGTS